ncbi:unnamed protein product [Darwinula stevensoni]|uniref:Uncharacterized protein n=1 Tax=Darwinula stevensoni TaxID=69355 RepID=A0A7R9FU53_9CRUS|nr:unnamed protein product [Darwinula stevensoni]CAG0906988.1 unnamed protein product [Darwinula stevensoni]
MDRMRQDSRDGWDDRGRGSAALAGAWRKCCLRLWKLFILVCVFVTVLHPMVEFTTAVLFFLVLMCFCMPVGFICICAKQQLSDSDSLPQSPDEIHVVAPESAGKNTVPSAPPVTGSVQDRIDTGSVQDRIDTGSLPRSPDEIRSIPLENIKEDTIPSTPPESSVNFECPPFDPPPYNLAILLPGSPPSPHPSVISIPEIPPPPYEHSA